MSSRNEHVPPTWEVWRSLKRLELLSAAPPTTLTALSCFPNFPRAQYLDKRNFFTPSRPQTESLFTGYYVFRLRFVSPTTQTSVGSVSFWSRFSKYNTSFMRQRVYVEILSTQGVWRAPKRRESCWRRRQ